MFSDMLQYIYFESLFNTLYKEIKKNSYGQNKRTKIHPFFISRTPTHHSFSFNLRFLCKLF